MCVCVLHMSVRRPDQDGAPSRATAQGAPVAHSRRLDVGTGRVAQERLRAVLAVGRVHGAHGTAQFRPAPAPVSTGAGPDPMDVDYDYRKPTTADIPRLVTLVREGTEKQKEYAAEALGMLTIGGANRVAIANAGGIESLVTLMRGGTEMQKHHALMALRFLSGYTDVIDNAIVAAGGIPVLVALARKETGNGFERAWATALLGELNIDVATWDIKRRLQIDAAADHVDCRFWSEVFPKFEEIRDAVQEDGKLYDFLASKESEFQEMCDSETITTSPKTLSRLLLSFKILGAAATAQFNPSALAATTLLKKMAMESVKPTEPTEPTEPTDPNREPLDTPEFRAMESMKDEYNDQARHAEFEELGLDDAEIQKAQRFEHWMAIAGVIASKFNAAAEEGSTEAKEIIELADALVQRLAAPPGLSDASSILFEVDTRRLKRQRLTAAQISASLAAFFGHEKVARLKLRAEDLHPLLGLGSWG